MLLLLLMLIIVKIWLLFNRTIKKGELIRWVWYQKWKIKMKYKKTHDSVKSDCCWLTCRKAGEALDHKEHWNDNANKLLEAVGSRVLLGTAVVGNLEAAFLLKTRKPTASHRNDLSKIPWWLSTVWESNHYKTLPEFFITNAYSRGRNTPVDSCSHWNG